MKKSIIFISLFSISFSSISTFCMCPCSKKKQHPRPGYETISGDDAPGQTTKEIKVETKESQKTPYYYKQDDRGNVKIDSAEFEKVKVQERRCCLVGAVGVGCFGIFALTIAITFPILVVAGVFK